jgi:hypothetical protein
MASAARACRARAGLMAADRHAISWRAGGQAATQTGHIRIVRFLPGIQPVTPICARTPSWGPDCCGYSHHDVAPMSQTRESLCWLRACAFLSAGQRQR